MEWVPADRILFPKPPPLNALAQFQNPLPPVLEEVADAKSFFSHWPLSQNQSLQEQSSRREAVPCGIPHVARVLRQESNLQPFG